MDVDGNFQHYKNLIIKKVIFSVAILVSEILDLVSPKDFGMT